MTMAVRWVPGSAGARARCAFARVEDVGRTSARVVEACVDDASCARCLAAALPEAYGETFEATTATATAACALASFGTIEDATARARALTRAMACAPRLFTANDAREAREALRAWRMGRSTRACADARRAFRSTAPMDAMATNASATRDDGVRRIRVRSTASEDACCAACADDDGCDGWSWCDARAPTGRCGKDYLVFPFESGECLHFRFVDDASRRAFVDDVEEFTREDGGWISSFISRARAPEKKRPSPVALDARRGTRTAYVRPRVESKRARKP